jgi:hypothetical protein
MTSKLSPNSAACHRRDECSQRTDPVPVSSPTPLPTMNATASVSRITLVVAVRRSVRCNSSCASPIRYTSRTTVGSPRPS